MSDLEQLKNDIGEIKQALLGNEFNNHKGVVYQVKDIDERVSKLENFEKELSVYLKQAKVLIVLFITALITLILKVFTIK